MALLRIKVSKPKVTLGDKDVTAAIGSTFMGPVGGFVGGQAYGEKIGNWSENQWNNLTGKNAREAQKKAMQEAERTRRDNIIRSFEASQQADSLSYSAAMRGQGGSGASNNAPGIVGQGGAAGTIGANISSSGTF